MCKVAAIWFCLNAEECFKNVLFFFFCIISPLRSLGTHLCSIYADRFSVKGGSRQPAGGKVWCSGTSLLGTTAMRLSLCINALLLPHLFSTEGSHHFASLWEVSWGLCSI